MSKYFFLSGQHPKLSNAEVNAVLGSSTEIEMLDSGCIVDGEINPEIIDSLGGTVKIGEVIDRVEKDYDKVLEKAAELLSFESKPVFAISPIKLDHLELPDGQDVKNLLKSKFNLSSRYRESSVFGVASAALLRKSKLIELLLIDYQDEILVVRTIATQDINQWTMRDRHRPYANRKKGMLPPKVARIMVNLALNGDSPEDKTIYDPFCGSGTVLQEALLADTNVLGTDLDPDAISGTRENLQWLETKYEFQGKSALAIADVAKFKPTQKVDYIVTEPFLGKPKPRPDFVPKMFSGLERLFLGAFKNWSRFLEDGAKIVIVFPLIELGHKRFSLDVLIDKLEKIGYTLISEPMIYGRPDAVTQRQICQFSYKSKKE